MDTKTFCELCSTRLTHVSERQWKCSGCGQDHYANPTPAVEIALLDENKRVLVCRRGRNPNKGKLDFPGGFVEPGETLEEAGLRELHEELGVDKDDITGLKYINNITVPYAYQNKEYQVVVILFVAKFNGDHQLIQTNDDVADAFWIGTDDLNETDFATTKHYQNAQLILQRYAR